MTTEPLYKEHLKVRDYECDIQGIVNNANYQHYYEIARHEFLEKNGYHFAEKHKEGIDAVMISILIRYSNSLQGGDNFICTIDSVEKDGIRYIFNQKIIREKDGKTCSTARVETVMMADGKLREPKVLDLYLGRYVGL